MRKQRSGLLVHISSPLGRRTLPFSGPYAMCKWAMEAMAETLRYELAHLGVDSVIVEPGIFATGLDDRRVVMLDGPRSEDYVALRDFGLGVLDRRAGAPEGHPVAEAVADLIETPPGKRPLRTPVGAPGIDRLNDISDEMQAELFKALGIEELVRVRPEVGGSESD
jgi:NAD(P)-dependent dehydrogenase (short-subunit alcohol dehydrogenase family)